MAFHAMQYSSFLFEASLSICRFPFEFLDDNTMLLVGAFRQINRSKCATPYLFLYAYCIPSKLWQRKLPSSLFNRKRWKLESRHLDHERAVKLSRQNLNYAKLNWSKVKTFIPAVLFMDACISGFHCHAIKK